MTTPQDIVDVLNSRGWMARIVSAADVDLVDVDPKGLLKCVDGRVSDKADGMHGPKTLGGIYAIASMRGVSDAAGLAGIVNEVREAGYVPSVHGDTHAGAMGCGYFKLWSQGNLPGHVAPNFSADEGRDAVVAAEGEYEMLQGDHWETQVVINLVPNKTLVPNDSDQRFVVDGWVLGQFGLDVPTYLTLAASTVEQLSSTCRSARIVVP